MNNCVKIEVDKVVEVDDTIEVTRAEIDEVVGL